MGKKPTTVSMVSNPIKIVSYNRAEVKQPFSTVPTSDDMCGWIGKLAITWGEVELCLEDLAIALLKSTSTPAPNRFPRLGFRCMKELCKKLSAVEFSAEPTISAALASILGHAADVHWRRNTVLHGRLKTELKVVRQGDPLKGIAPVVDAFVTASGVHKRKPTTLYLSTKDMERLFYEVGHVLGSVKAFITPEEGAPGLSSADIARLRTFLVANHPNLPRPATP